MKKHLIQNVSKNILGIGIAVLVVGLGFFAFSVYSAQSAPVVVFSENFGSGESEPNPANWQSPGWAKHEAGTTAKKPTIGNESVSPNGERFARIAEDSFDHGTQDGWICIEIDGTDYTDLELAYYWRGDKNANSSDDGMVEARNNGKGDAVCSAPGGWTTLKNHDLKDDSSWNFQAAFGLPDGYDGDKFLLRFRNDSSRDDEQFRVDGIEITGERENQGEIHGTKYDWDTENGLEGWTIWLYGDNEFATSTVTNEEGEYWFMGLPDGEYEICEENREGWEQTHPNEGAECDNDTTGHEVGIEGGEQVYRKNFTNKENTEIKIIAHKVICEDEADLPNWAKGNDTRDEDAPHPIDEDTASDFVEESEGACWFYGEKRWETGGWEFEWGHRDVEGHIPGPGHYGYAPHEGWNTFGPTDDGMTMDFVAFDDIKLDKNGNHRLWVREVLKEGYIPFTQSAKESEPDDFSAEMYCHLDGLRYDNHDKIQGDKDGKHGDLKPGDTYYCVGFNARINGPHNKRLLVGKWNDEDASGGRNGEEEKISDWSVRLYDWSWNFVEERFTDDGSDPTPSAERTMFSGLTEDKYYLCEEDREGWEQTYPLPHNRTSPGPALNQSPNSEEEAEYCLQITSWNKPAWVSAHGFGNRRVENQCEPGVELFENEGFEYPEVSGWDVFFTGEPLLEWITGRNKIEIQNNVAGSPHSGEQHAELDPHHPTEIWQEIPTVPGETYKVTTWYSPRPRRDADDNEFEFRLDGSALGDSISRSGTENSDTVWTLEERSFVATSDSHSVGFAEVGTDTSYGAYLDDVSVMCIPEEPQQCEYGDGDGWADEVEDSEQGTKKGGSPIIDINRTNPESVLGAADFPDSGSFFSLGVEGWIIVSFDGIVEDGPDEDISIHEATNGRDTYPEENALIEVSQNGDDWHEVGTASSQASSGVSYFDFSGTGLDWIKYVRVSDTTDFSLHSSSADGFDLDAVDAIGECNSPRQQCIVEGYKYDSEEEPLEGWEIGLGEYYDFQPLSLTDGPQEIIYDEWGGEWSLIGSDTTDEEGYFCIEKELKQDGPKTSISIFDSTYYLGETMKEGWHFDDVDGGYGEGPFFDSFFDVFVEVNLGDEGPLRVDFYNEEDEEENHTPTSYQCSDGKDNDDDGDIDYPNDAGCESPNDDNEGDGGSISGGRAGNNSVGGSVLGASVSCSELYLNDFLHMNRGNDRSEVIRLQSFLKFFMGYDLALTGVFDQETFAAVVRFQNQYGSDILNPWSSAFSNLDNVATGYVYQTTRWKINNLVCPDVQNFPSPLVPDPGTTIR